MPSQFMFNGMPCPKCGNPSFGKDETLYALMHLTKEPTGIGVDTGHGYAVNAWWCQSCRYTELYRFEPLEV